MTQILKLPQLKEIDRMPQMQIRRGRIDAEFDSKRAPFFQLLFQFGLIDQLRATPFQIFYRLFWCFHVSTRERAERWPRSKRSASRQDQRGLPAEPADTAVDNCRPLIKPSRPLLQDLVT